MSDPTPPSVLVRDKPVRRNVLGIIAFVLGLIGLALSLLETWGTVPWPLMVAGVLSWPLVLLSIFHGAIGFRRGLKGTRDLKWLALVGLTLGIAGLVVSVLRGVAFIGAVDDPPNESDQTRAVVFEVTGTATDVFISYGVYRHEFGLRRETVATLPWRKDVQITGIITRTGQRASVLARPGPDGGTVTCTVKIDGEVTETRTVTGAGEFAYCAGQ